MKSLMHSAIIQVQYQTVVPYIASGSSYELKKNTYKKVLQLIQEETVVSAMMAKYYYPIQFIISKKMRVQERTSNLLITWFPRLGELKGIVLAMMRKFASAKINKTLYAVALLVINP